MLAVAIVFPWIRAIHLGYGQFTLDTGNSPWIRDFSLRYGKFYDKQTKIILQHEIIIEEQDNINSENMTLINIRKQMKITAKIR